MANPAAELYPPTPRDLPEMTLVTGAYRLRVVLVLFSLFVFLAIYLGMIAGSIWLLAWCWRAITISDSLVFSIIGLIGAALLLLFLIKGLFKRQPLETNHLVEVTEAEQPRLFGFIRQLCRDAGSPFPGKIYLTHDVNAAVAYPQSLLTLFWPVRKNLIIGLGLVNLLNLSELKGVLAHEFGHFAQSTMKLGQYVYIANKVIHDMVYQRDFWDEMLYKGAQADIRIALFVWGLLAIVWLLRKVLAGLFIVTNLFSFSLSRQMEFNADLHSVRLAGSDALISGLWQAERGAIAFQIASGELASRAEHRTYTDDLFFHQSRALERLPEVFEASGADKQEYGYLLAPYAPGTALHFPASEAHHATMWETHPPHHEREQNVKRSYVALPVDERPAWDLFVGQPALKRRMTLAAYQAFGDLDLAPGDLTPAAEVEERIREERAEMKQSEHYHGLYDDRFLDPGDVGGLARELDASAGTLTAEALRARAAEHTGEALQAATGRRRSLGEELELLSAVEMGALDPFQVGSEVNFRGQPLHAIDVAGSLARVQEALDAVEIELAGVDKAVFCYFYHLSGRDTALREELLRRYQFLLAVQRLLQNLNPVERRIDPILTHLQQGGTFGEEDGAFVVDSFREAHRELWEAVVETDSIFMPQLTHLQEGQSVRSFVLPPSEPFIVWREHELTGAWIADFVTQLLQVIGRLRKLHYKNLGVLLRLQESLDPALYL